MTSARAAAKETNCLLDHSCCLFCFQVSTLTAPTRPVLKFLTYPSGQGIVYNVIVQDPQNDKEAAYSPVATYGCDVCEEKCKL